MKKKIIFIQVFLLLSFFYNRLAAQSLYLKDSAFVRFVGDLPVKEPFDTAHPYHLVEEKYLYLLSDNDVYNLFGYETGTRYYKFDFASYHILGEQRCEYCDITPSHRNAHEYKWVWIVRDNKKAFEEVPVIQTRGGRGHKEIQRKVKRLSYKDTVVRGTMLNDTATWHTSGGGDCFARLEYRIFKDKNHSVLLLKEWSYNGGCRAGGYWDFEITFLLPSGINYYSKRTILAEKYKGSPSDIDN